MLDSEYYGMVISKYKICDVLLIDDLFKGKINESDINIMFEIVNYRSSRVKCKVINRKY